MKREVSHNMRLLGLLSLGHMVVDINGGALPGLLPFLKASLSLSYTSSGIVILMANVSSSLIQPLFGYFADKKSRHWMLPISVLLSAIGIAFAGVATSYAVLLALIVISGIGIAFYHPEGYRTAGRVAGEKHATGVSVFSTGGNIGIALGPPLITALIVSFGMIGSLGMLVPGVVMAICLAVVQPKLASPLSVHTTTRRRAGRNASVWAMAVLIVVVALRSWTAAGFTTFVPFYYLQIMNGDPRLVGTLLAVFLGSGALGTLLAGPIADRIGVRRYAVSVFLLATPLAGGYLLVSGFFSYLLLAALGFVLVSTFTITVVLAQSYMPNNVGMASGLIVGFATGAGGLGVTILGWVADHWGLLTTLWISALMPLLAFAVSLLLPEPEYPSLASGEAQPESTGD